MFSYFKGTFQRNSCTFKKHLKSHNFIFHSAPCQISLSVHQSLCFTNTVYNVLFFKRNLPKNQVHFQKYITSHIFICYSAPCQISLSLHQSLFFTYSHNLFLFIFQIYLSKKQVKFTKKIKIPYIHFLQCVLSDFFIFASKFVFYLLSMFTIFSSSKEIGALSKII